jgi:hypothetical protein
MVSELRLARLALRAGPALGIAGTVRAEPEVVPASWSLHAGPNLRTDIGPHRVRLDVGVQHAAWSLTLVVDPKVVVQGTQNDGDVLVEREIRSQWWVLAGWRTSWISIDRGRQWQHSLLLGGTAELPRLLGGRIVPRGGLELQATTLRHGNGLPTQWISFASQRDYQDLLSVNLFLRLHYRAGP